MKRFAQAISSLPIVMASRLPLADAATVAELSAKKVLAEKDRFQEIAAGVLLRAERDHPL
jgi:hypothetical protein